MDKLFNLIKVVINAYWQVNKWILSNGAYGTSKHVVKTIGDYCSYYP